MRHYFAAGAAVVLLVVPWVMHTYPDRVERSILAATQWIGDQRAAIVAHNAKSADMLRLKSLSGEKVRILIVPGHEPSYGGTEFGALKERDLTVDLAYDLKKYLSDDPLYEVTLTRSKEAWSPEFDEYFKTHWEAIKDWERSYVEEMSRLVSIGATSRPLPSVYHNKAPENVALRLYGITKWANENRIDLMIHIHFNDAPDHKPGVAGAHSGFAIYVPSLQYDNGTTTRAIADTVFARLAAYNPVSNLKGESEGIVDEPELIAIGANNTSDAASMLIEYSYIYEPQLSNPEVRAAVLDDLAYQTYLGLHDFFERGRPLASPSAAFGTAFLPYTWDALIPLGDRVSRDGFALQTALIADHNYPPRGETLNECPRTGKIGVCTKAALADFQKEYGITAEKGVVGEKTLQVLNQKYGQRQF